MQLVLDFIPEIGTTESLLDPSVELLLIVRPTQAQTYGNVLVNGARAQGDRHLEDHADLAPYQGSINTRLVDVEIIKLDRALSVGVGDGLVHAVEATEHGALPTA